MQLRINMMLLRLYWLIPVVARQQLRTKLVKSLSVEAAAKINQWPNCSHPQLLANVDLTCTSVYYDGVSWTATLPGGCPFKSLGHTVQVQVTKRPLASWWWRWCHTSASQCSPLVSWRGYCHIRWYFATKVSLLIALWELSTSRPGPSQMATAISFRNSWLLESTPRRRGRHQCALTTSHGGLVLGCIHSSSWHRPVSLVPKQTEYWNGQWTFTPKVSISTSFCWLP